MSYIDQENSVGVKEQNRRNNIRKSSLFRLQGQKEKIEELVHLKDYSRLIGKYPELEACQSYLSSLGQTFYTLCFEQGDTDSTILNLGNNYRNKSYGFSKEPSRILFREWLPHATRAWLMGDFNKWSRESHPMQSLGGGFFEIQLENDEFGKELIENGSPIRLLIELENGSFEEIMPPSARVVRID